MTGESGKDYWRGDVAEMLLWKCPQPWTGGVGCLAIILAVLDAAPYQRFPRADDPSRQRPPWVEERDQNEDPG